MLPDGDGYTLAKHIRKKGDTPILFLTAKNNPEDEVAGFNAGGDDYVMKPFIPKNLIYRIMALLRRSYKSEQEAIQIGQTLVSFRNASSSTMTSYRESNRKVISWSFRSRYFASAGRLIQRCAPWK